MAVTVRFFAAVRDRLGRDTVFVEAAQVPTLDMLLVHIGNCLGSEAAAALAAPEIRVALNQEFVSGDFNIGDGDEVAFMPPITGG